jgi:hypothetical protein
VLAGGALYVDVSFAKRCIEQVALRYTRTKDWTTGMWGKLSKSGIYAIYYMLIFAIAIPRAGT